MEATHFEQLTWQIMAIIGLAPIALLIPLWIDSLCRGLALRLRAH
jgi:hypothetical protein